MSGTHTPLSFQSGGPDRYARIDKYGNLEVCSLSAGSGTFVNDIVLQGNTSQTATVDPSSTNGIAIGHQTTVFASSPFSVALGSLASSASQRGIAIGYVATVDSGSDGSIAIGNFCVANGPGTIAIGPAAVVQANYGIAIGGSSSPTPVIAGSASVSIGANTRAYNFSVALGPSSTAAVDPLNVLGECVAIGQFAVAGVTAVGGNKSIAIGNATQVSGDFTIVIGAGSTATGASALAIGHLAASNGQYSAAVGNQSASAGQYGTALGSFASAANTGSVSVGSNATSTANYAVSLGPWVTNATALSVAIGVGGGSPAAYDFMRLEVSQSASQTTSISTPVVLNCAIGQLTLQALLHGNIGSFTFSNNRIVGGSIIFTQLASYGGHAASTLAPIITVPSYGSGACLISVANPNSAQDFAAGDIVFTFFVFNTAPL
jgi:hypothetical protein